MGGEAVIVQRSANPRSCSSMMAKSTQLYSRWNTTPVQPQNFSSSNGSDRIVLISLVILHGIPSRRCSATSSLKRTMLGRWGLRDVLSWLFPQLAWNAVHLCLDEHKDSLKYGHHGLNILKWYHIKSAVEGETIFQNPGSEFLRGRSYHVPSLIAVSSPRNSGISVRIFAIWSGN